MLDLGVVPAQLGAQYVGAHRKLPAPEQNKSTYVEPGKMSPRCPTDISGHQIESLKHGQSNRHDEKVYGMHACKAD